MMKCKIAILSLVLFSFSLQAQRPYEQSWPPDVAAPARFRANRTSYSAIMDVLRPGRPRVTAERLEALRGIQLENIWKALNEYQTCYVRGFKGTRKGERLIGRALTIRYLPSRPDLRVAQEKLAKEGDWPLGYHARAAEEVQPGDVLVVEAGGLNGTVFFGDMSALGIKLRGAAGVVIDGGSRDLTELQSDAFKNFPVFARFYDVPGARWTGSEWNVPVRIDDVTVLPGDIVVADEAAILFFPPELLDAVIKKAGEHEEMESYERSLITQKKYLFRDVYPPAPKLLEKFESGKKRSSGK